MTTLVHLSDLHFGRERDEVVEGLHLAIEAISPDLVVVSGDLTQRAKRDEFRAAHRFLERLKWPWLAVPGNHDLPAVNVLRRLVGPWECWREYIGRNLEPEYHAPGVFAVGVNTARRFGFYADWSRGRINVEQCQGMQERFKGAGEGELRLLVAHHPFWLPPDWAHRNIIGGRDEALPWCKDAGVDVILSGHIHIDFTHELEGMLVSHAGTAVSNRVPTGWSNSFNLIRGDRSKLEISPMRWTGDRFAVGEVRHFAKTNGVWTAAVI